jgi:WD40 repeat protein
MAWPLSQDYNEAVQAPHLCFADDDLRASRAATDALGLPVPRSGNFADVYEMRGEATGRRWAVKCFTRQVPGLRQRYRQISAYFAGSRLPFAVGLQYLEQGIRVRGHWNPVLKMDWVEGLLLNEFVRESLDKPQVLEALADLWVRLAHRLRRAGVAHGDLQHGNVLLVPGSRPGALTLKLVDYDGMFVPALAGRPSGEVGHPAYQHPQRLREATYGPEVDRFPLLVIYVSIRALMVGGRGLWDRYDNGDNLLFREQDLSSPRESALVWELVRLNDPELRRLADRLSRAAYKPLDQVPHLEDLVAAKTDSSLVGVPPEPPPPRVAAKEVRSAPSTATESALLPEPWPNPGPQSKPYVLPVVAAVAAMALLGLLLGGLSIAFNPGVDRSASERVVAQNPLGVVGEEAQVRPKEPAPQPVPKRAPLPEPESEPNPASKPEPKGEPLPERAPEHGAVLKPELKPAPTPEPPPQLQAGPKPDPEPDRHPDPKPGPGPEPKPQAKSPSIPPTESPPGKLPVPTDAEQIAAKKLIKDIFKEEYAKREPAARQALAAKLLQKGLETTDDKSVRFVLFREARDLAAQGSDQAAASQAVDQMVKEYAVDALDMKVIVLRALTAAADTAEANEALAEWALALADDAVAEGSYETALRLLEGADPAARKAKNVALVTQVQAKRKRVEELRKEGEDVEGVAARQLKMVKDLIREAEVARLKGDQAESDRLMSKARDRLHEISKKFPGTRAGSQAKDLAMDPTKEPGKGGGEMDPTKEPGKGGGKMGPAKEPGKGGGAEGKVAKDPEKASSEGTTAERKGSKEPEKVLPPRAPEQGTPGNGGTSPDCVTLRGYNREVYRACFSPDGKHLASASFDKTIKVWDSRSGQELLSFKGHTGYVFGVCFSPDGKRLASSSQDGTVKVWDAHSGQVLLALKGTDRGTGDVFDVCFSPDGRRLAACGGGLLTEPGGVVKVWDSRTGQQILSLQGYVGNIRTVCFSPDGTRLASARGWDDLEKNQQFGEVKVWDARTGREVLSLKAHTGDVMSVCFSPDGKRLASDSGDAVRVWDAQTGQELLTLKGHSMRVTSVCYSPDGKRLASASWDGTVKVWDAQTGQELLTLKGHDNAIYNVCFSPDGTRLATASADRTAKVWDVQVRQEQAPR